METMTFYTKATLYTKPTRGKGLDISRNRGGINRGDKYEIIQKKEHCREMAKRGTCV